MGMLFKQMAKRTAGKRLVVKMLSLFIGLLVTGSVAAATWNEPWFEEYLGKTTHLLKVKVLNNSSHEFADVEVIATLAGKPVSGKIRISGFFSLNLCTDQGDPIPGIWLTQMDTCYLFVQQGKGKTFMLPTPTSGIVPLNMGWVNCAFRHSYHSFVIRQEFFESGAVAAWKIAHNQTVSTDEIRPEVEKWLSMDPVSPFGSTEIDFYHQQAALELVHLLGLKGYNEQIRKFAEDFQTLHQLAAFRAFRADPSEELSRYLFDEVRNPDRNKMVRLMALEALILSPYKPERSALERYYSEADDSYVGFGGDIRDPRICTTMSGLKKTAARLLRMMPQ